MPVLFVIFMSCALEPTKEPGLVNENDWESDTTFFESYPCWQGKTLHTEEHM